ncbi:MAG: hypothetical protein ACK559_13790, partial [bacterium]
HEVGLAVAVLVAADDLLAGVGNAVAVRVLDVAGLDLAEVGRTVIVAVGGVGAEAHGHAGEAARALDVAHERARAQLEARGAVVVEHRGVLVGRNVDLADLRVGRAVLAAEVEDVVDVDVVQGEDQ